MKKILLSTIFFIMGFFTHAFFFPDTFTNVWVDTKNIVLQENQPTPYINKRVTTITFDGKRFSDHSIQMETASYVIIKNLSKDSNMELVSNNPLLSTTRPYGFSEAINQRLDKSGIFIIRDKNNSKEEIVIVVK